MDAMPRKKPMTVIVGGMPKTGTSSITKALEQLGFTIYDNPSRMWNGDLARWQPMLRAKVEGNQRPLVRSDLDAMTNNFDVSKIYSALGHFICGAFQPKLTKNSFEQAISDSPCFFMVEEIAQAYPEALVLLNERESVDKWVRSIQTSIGAVSGWNWHFRVFGWFDPSFSGVIAEDDRLCYTLLCDNDFFNDALLRRRYEEHYQRIREQVDPRRVMTYRVQDGWGPLCKFLGRPVPDGPFPRVGESEWFVEDVKSFWWLCFRRSAFNAAVWSAGIALVVGALYTFGFPTTRSWL